ncbi:hypothetical protein AGMMS50212_13080 [Spirochaetia bacterium]|nr:hypothetical protein AGMMS50212_13080 [Spirochaetia bacterium]
MIKMIGAISEKCDYYGIPLMVLAYPRKEMTTEFGTVDDNYLLDKKNNNDAYVKLVSHCVRIAVELGADIVKTHFTGNVETFSKVIQSANGKPVLIAGGEMMEELDILKLVRDSMSAGASGVCIGRNVFNAKSTENMISALKCLMYNNESVENAYKELNICKERCFETNV